MKSGSKQMTSRQRLLASFTGGQPDRIGWAPLMDNYYLASLPEDFQRKQFGRTIKHGNIITEALYLSEQWRRRITDFTRLINADVFERHAPGLKFHIDDLTVEQNPQDNRKILRRHITSVGVLTDVLYSVPESPCMPFFGAEYKLKTLDDIKVYRHIWQNTHFEPDYQAFLDEDAFIGDDGIAAIDGPQSAVQFLLGEEAGAVNFYYLLQDYPEQMEDLIETMHAKIRSAYEIIADSPSKVVIAMEDLSSSTSSPEIFQRYTWRHLNEYADILHPKGKIFLAHACGLLKAMAPLITKSRLDGIESLTPPTVGNFTVAQARRAWGKDFIIVGGLNAHVMLETNQDKVLAAVLDVFKQAAPGSNFVLSNSDAMPYGVTLETLRTISKAVKEHGTFPQQST